MAQVVPRHRTGKQGVMVPDQKTVLLLTRPKADSDAFLKDIHDRTGHEVPALIDPVIKVKTVDDVGDLDYYAAVICTSRHAVRIAGHTLRGVRVATVGLETARLAEDFGAHATRLGDNVEQFLSRIGELEGPAIHLRGVHSRGDLATRAIAAGLHVDEKIVYDQVERRLGSAAKEVLKGGQGVVPIFSPRSGQIILRNSVHPETRILAMSAAVASAWDGQAITHVAENATKRAMLELVLRVL